MQRDDLRDAARVRRAIDWIRSAFGADAPGIGRIEPARRR